MQLNRTGVITTAAAIAVTVGSLTACQSGSSGSSTPAAWSPDSVNSQIAAAGVTVGSGDWVDQYDGSYMQSATGPAGTAYCWAYNTPTGDPAVTGDALGPVTAAGASWTCTSVTQPDLSGTPTGSTGGSGSHARVNCHASLRHPLKGADCTARS